jgi:hypothetical protein
VADDAHLGIGIVAQAFGEAVQDGGEVALDVRAVGVEGDVAGNVELELLSAVWLTFTPVPWVACSISRFCFSMFCDQM